MKSFREYLTESKKLYSFKVKVAGEVPEKFQENLKLRLDKCSCIKLEQVAKTAVQKLPLDFPTHENMEVTVFEMVCEYPITAPQVAVYVKELGIDEDCFRVRGSGEPSEVDQLLLDDEDKEIKEVKVKHKDYFGDDFNKGFLKDLNKAAKDRKKDQGAGEYKLPKAKEDKAGAKSAIGS